VLQLRLCIASDLFITIKMGSAMDEFIPFITKMMADPPDPNVVPLGNRHATVYGVTLPFHVSLIIMCADKSSNIYIDRSYVGSP
jgi:hypothetical protein